MGKEQDLQIAKKRAKNGDKSLFWYGYALALEGYNQIDIGKRKYTDPALWSQIQPSGNQSDYEIKSAIKNAKLNTSDDCYLWIGYAAGVEGLNLAEAEDRLKTESIPREHLRNRPYKPADGKKVRNVLWSFTIALGVSFAFANLVAIIVLSVTHFILPNIKGFGSLDSLFSYFAMTIAIWMAETLLFKTMLLTYLCARKYHSFKYVVLKGMFGGKIPAGGKVAYIFWGR